MKKVLIAEVTISQTIEYDISVEVHNVKSHSICVHLVLPCQNELYSYIPSSLF